MFGFAPLSGALTTCVSHTQASIPTLARAKPVRLLIRHDINILGIRQCLKRVLSCWRIAYNKKCHIMLKIYHSPGTRGFRTIWICEELSVPYEIVPVNFAAEYRATPEWRVMNPVGKVPVMRDGDMTMFESCAMTQYVLARYGEGRLQPAKDDPAYAYYLQWSWFAEATFARPLGEIVNHRREFKPELNDVVAEMKSRATACVTALEGALADRPYLLGDTVSAADLSICYTTRGYRRMVTEALPDTFQAYFDRVTGLPSYAATVGADAETAKKLKS